MFPFRTEKTMRKLATAVCITALMFTAACAGEEEAEMDDLEMEPAGEMMEEGGMGPDTTMMMDTVDTMMDEGMPEEMMEEGGGGDEMGGGG
jgi:hypothetical protein